MDVRVATGADAPDVARVQVETWRASYAGLVPQRALDDLSVPAAASHWEGHIAHPERHVWVAEHEDAVVGLAAAGPSRDEGAAVGEVYALYVHPARQRTGAGRALLAAAESWLAGQGYATASLWVLAANAGARAFYERRGWAHDGTEQDIDLGSDAVREVRYRMAFLG